MRYERNGKASDPAAVKSILARPAGAVGYQGGRCHDGPEVATCHASAAKKVSVQASRK